MRFQSKKHALMSGAAVTLLTVLLSSPATAQTTEDDEVIVTGIRSSLKQSYDFKRDADQVVDAITAEDVGKFPDNNVVEALQRITGVAIDRSGGEGQFVTVRGLGPEFNAVLMNGRTIATDNPGRQFSFDVLSADIIQRAEVLKSSTPDTQSGGIGSVVNIVTARPFDRPGQHATFAISGTYDQLRENISPEITGVASWTNENNTIGLLLGGSYSDRSSQIDQALVSGFPVRAGGVTVNRPESSTGLTAADLDTIADGVRFQQNAVLSRDVQERERIALNGTFQARPSDNVQLTVDALYSKFDINSFDTQFSGFFNPPIIDPVIDANGTVTAFTRPGSEFGDRNPLIAGAVGLSQNDNVLNANNRFTDTYVIGANLEWGATEDLTINFDVSNSNAKNDQTNPFVVLGAQAVTSPRIILPEDEGIFTFDNLTGLRDASLQRLHFVNINRSAVEDDIIELRADADWNIDRGPLAAVEFGLLHTNRSKSQDVATSGSESWCAYCGYNVPFDTSILNPFALDGFLNGVTGADQIPTEFFNASFADAFRVLNDPANLNNPNRTGGTPAEQAADVARLQGLAAAGGNTEFGIYEPIARPGQSFRVDEDITSFYVNTQWEGDFGGDLPWSANVGFRLAETKSTSFGVDQPLLSVSETPGDTQLVFQFGATTPVSVENTYTNFLPSANVKLETSEDTVMRFGVSKTVTRPTLTSLGVNNTYGGRSNAPTSGGGNPNLVAFEATNYDASFEWYPDEASIVSVSAFHKSFGEFLETATLPIPRTITIPAGNQGFAVDTDISVDFQDTRSRNGEEGSITGFEAAVQKSFDNGFGAGANYTYVSSDIQRATGSGASDCDYNGLSPHTVNVNGFYEKNRIQARVAYNYRDEFLFQCFGPVSEPQTREAFGQIDLSAAYDVNDTFQVFFEGINVLSQESRDYSRFRNRILNVTDTGSRFTLGVRGSF